MNYNVSLDKIFIQMAVENEVFGGDDNGNDDDVAVVAVGGGGGGNWVVVEA